MKYSAVIFRCVLVLCGAGALVAWEVVRLRSESSAPTPKPSKSVRELAGCVEQSPVSPGSGERKGFVDVTDQMGLDFQHLVGPLGTYFMPESTGAGGALADLNGDGRLDLYLLNCGRSPKASGPLPPGSQSENRLFLQTEEGRFVDATIQSGLGDSGYGSGCAVGDVNNDGHPDIFITNYGQDELYLNEGSGTFRKVTQEAGFQDADWGASAAFVDYDRDGWLDLVVVNYTADPTYGHSVACGFREGLVSYCGPHKFLPTVDRLYHNDGPQPAGGPSVRFTDVTTSAGFDSSPTFGFGVVCFDANGDSWPDVLIANDGAPNRLWVNQRDGTFQEQASLLGVAVNGQGESEAGMGVALGDVNRDGRFDLALTHLSTESTTLYLSDDAGGFVDRTGAAHLRPLTMRHTGWGTSLVDLDLDGVMDLPIANGLVVPCHSGFPFHGEDAFQVRKDFIGDPQSFWLDYADENVLLMGNADLTFRANSALGGDFCSAVGSARSMITGDLDRDGDVDLVVTYCGSRARIYRNDFPKKGHWLMIRAVDSDRKRASLGAVVTVVAGNRRWIGQIHTGGSYLASNDPCAHFGLADTRKIDQFIVQWPDGPVESSIEVFPGGITDREVTLRRGEGQPGGILE